MEQTYIFLFINIGYWPAVFMFVVVSAVNVTLDLSLNFLTELSDFWIISGIIYPLTLNEKVLLTTLSCPWLSSVIVLKVSILDLNLNLSGSPQ